MAKGTKTGGRDFQNGNPGGPGRPKVPEEMKSARKLNRLEFERILNKYIHLNRLEINEVIKSAELPMIEMIVAKILAFAFNEGDQKRTEFVLDRLIGRVKDAEPVDDRTKEDVRNETINRLVTMITDKGNGR